jgi:uncharacterized membrane protein YgcG
VWLVLVGAAPTVLGASWAAALLAPLAMGTLWGVLTVLWRPQRRPLTSAGRDVLARTTAFRRFVAEVHADPLTFAAEAGTSHQHPAVALLPYAVVLGLADSWYARFEPLMTRLVADAAGDVDAWWLHQATYAPIVASYHGALVNPAQSSTSDSTTSSGPTLDVGGGNFGGGGAGSGGGGGGGSSW